MQAGIAAEVVASVGIGLALLLVFREQDLSIFGDTLGAEALSGGSVVAGLLAALAVGGWVFIGFDVCVAAAEETRDAARHVPRAIWIALLSVGALVILNALAVTLAHPDPAAIVAGADVDPVTTAVVSSFGSWSAKPFAAVVLVAFLACGMAAQALTARTIYSIARDDVLPASRFLRTRRPPQNADRRRSPRPPSSACLGLLLGLDATAVGQPDRLRHRRDLRVVPAGRRWRRCRAPARDVGARGRRPARARRHARERAGGRAGWRSRRSTSRGRGRRSRRPMRPGTRCGRRRWCWR